MKLQKLIILLLLVSFCGGSAEPVSTPVEEETIVTTSTSSTTTTTSSSTSTSTAVPLSQTESYAQNNTLDQLVSTEMWNLFDTDPPKSIYPEDLRRIEVLQTKLSDIYPEVQITSIYDEQTYQYHEKYCAEYNITECSLPYISDEHSYVTTTTYPTEYAGEQIISDLKLEILNCPSDKVDIEIGEDVEIKFSVQAEDFDVTSIFYYFELNGEYYSRLPLDKENHSEYFDFPTANDITYSSTYVEKLAEGDSYLVSIDVLDEELFSSYDLCKVDF